MTSADTDLNHLYPPFKAKVQMVLADMAEYARVHMIGWQWIVVEGFRTAEYQHGLWEQGRTKKGRIVTQRDGYKRESDHQSSLAVDIVPKSGHTIDWDGKKEWWDYLAHCARAHGLESGHDWEHFPDDAHVQWPEGDKKTYEFARQWQKEAGLR